MRTGCGHRAVRGRGRAQPRRQLLAPGRDPPEPAPRGGLLGSPERELGGRRRGRLGLPLQAGRGRLDGEERRPGGRVLGVRAGDTDGC
uniref:Uncharacterized protein n=1 Tax=Arundo donax TaxID=35708 RepID=A0A0A8Y881_ARUDO